MRVLIIDDDEGTRILISEKFEDIYKNPEIIEAATKDEAMLKAAQVLDLIMVDCILYGVLEGPDIIRTLKKLGHKARMLCMSTSEEAITEGDKAGADAICTKSELDNCLPNALSRWGLLAA